MGPVVVGKNARIGANAVVTKNVPENAVMVGIPAKMLEQQLKNLNLMLLQMVMRKKNNEKLQG